MSLSFITPSTYIMEDSLMKPKLSLVALGLTLIFSACSTTPGIEDDVNTVSFQVQANYGEGSHVIAFSASESICPSHHIQIDSFYSDGSALDVHMTRESCLSATRTARSAISPCPRPIPKADTKSNGPAVSRPTHLV